MNTEPKAPTFIKVVGQIQTILASIVGSTLVVLYITTFDVIKDIYKSNPKSLENLRENICSIALILTCLIGVSAIIGLLIKLLEFKKNYTELMEMKKIKEEKGE